MKVCGLTGRSVSPASLLLSDYYYESHDGGLEKLFPQLGALQFLYLLCDRENITQRESDRVFGLMLTHLDNICAPE